MHFGFTLELSDIDLWNIDLLDTHVDFLDTDIPCKFFFHSVLKTSSRHVFWKSSRHGRLQDAFSVTMFCLPRRLARCFQEPSRHLQDVFTRRFQDVLEDVKLLRWRRVKTSSRRLQDQQMFAGYTMSTF